MITLLALALCLVGFAALALAMDRHQRQVWQRARPRGRAPLRLVGAAALGAALAACVAHVGWATGLVLWTGLLSAAALAVALVMSYRPQLFTSVSRCRGRDAETVPLDSLACSPALLFGPSMVVLSALVYVAIPPAPKLALPGTAVASDASDSAVPGVAAKAQPGLLPAETLRAVAAEAGSSEGAAPVQASAPAAEEAVAETASAVEAQAAPPADVTGDAGDSVGGHEADIAEIPPDAASAVPGLVRDYVAGVRARLEAPTAYRSPARRLRHGDDVLVYLVIGRDGKLLDRQLAQSSGDWRLDAAALQRVQASQPLPPLPAGLAQARLALVLPIAVSTTGPRLHPGQRRPSSAPMAPPAFPQHWRDIPYPGSR